MISKRFSIEFKHADLDLPEIYTAAAAQSLLALDCLARLAARALYGTGCDTELNLQPGAHAGEFAAELTVSRPTDLSTDAAGKIYALVLEIIRLGKFICGSTADKSGCLMTLHERAAALYRLSLTQLLLSRLTQTLELQKISALIFTSSTAAETEVITKAERAGLRCEAGVVLADSETEVLLEVIGPLTNGSGTGWRFCVEPDGLEFTADVTDKKFLQDVTAGRIKFACGTKLRAFLRTVKIWSAETVTQRTITEVKEVVEPTP